MFMAPRLAELICSFLCVCLANFSSRVVDCFVRRGALTTGLNSRKGEQPLLSVCIRSRLCTLYRRCKQVDGEFRSRLLAILGNECGD